LAPDAIRTNVEKLHARCAIIVLAQGCDERAMLGKVDWVGIVRFNARNAFPAAGRITAVGAIFNAFAPGVKDPFGRGVITLTMSVGGHDAHGDRGPARLPGGNDVVNDLPVVFAFAWLNVGPVEPKIDHRTGKTCSAAGAAFSAHPPLAGIGKQRVHLAN